MRTYTTVATMKSESPQERMFTETFIASCNGRNTEIIVSPKDSAFAAVVINMQAEEFGEYMAIGQIRPFDKLYEALSLGLWKGHVVTFSMPPEYYMHAARSLLALQREGPTIGAAYHLVHDEWERLNVSLPECIVETSDRMYKYLDYPHVTTDCEGRNIAQDVLFIWRICLAVAMIAPRAQGHMEAARYLARYLSEELNISPPLVWPTFSNVEERYPEMFMNAWNTRQGQATF